MTARVCIIKKLREMIKSSQEFIQVKLRVKFKWSEVKNWVKLRVKLRVKWS